jgi:hypothetical protein
MRAFPRLREPAVENRGGGLILSTIYGVLLKSLRTKAGLCVVPFVVLSTHG